ncbi:hypothetical protein CSPX01_01239 [Colletotrichum filicis]|nr:hypothetical protein CSPX01_01239 [Colletotrichum filicis]
MRYLRIIDLGLLGGWAGWRQARCAVTGKLQDPVGQLSVRDGEKENLRQRRSSRHSCHFQMRTDDMDMTWELGRWRGGRLWIKGRTNEQESRERGTGETRNGQTGQRANVTGRRGCEGGGGETRRDENVRRNVDGKEQREREKEQQPAPAKAPPRKYTRRDEASGGGKDARDGTVPTPYTPWLIPVRDYE